MRRLLAVADDKSLSIETARQTAGRLDLWVLVAIITAYIVLAGLYLSRPGLAWDEALYIPLANCLRQWFADLPASFSWQAIHNSLGRYQSHPPLAKYQMAVTLQLFANSMGPLCAARVASVLSTAALLCAVYLFTLFTMGRLAAVCAAVFLILMPRVFANGLLAVLDVPTALSWFVAAALFYLAMERPRLAWAAGLAAALAVSTKVNGLLLPVVLWPWGLYFYRKKALPAILWSLAAMPVVLFAIWPFLWAHPVLNIGKYLGEKFGFVVSAYRRFGVDLATEGDPIHRMMQRTAVPTLYFGRTFTNNLPWHFPVVMTAITTPVGILAAALAGALRWTRERANTRLFSFLIWNIAFWLIVFATPWAGAYDGVRLFLCIFPFIAILAGMGAEWGWKALGRLHLPTWAAAALVGVLVASQSVGLFSYGALGLSYYNILIGGLKGADARGFDATSWGETADPPLLDYINERAPRAAKVAVFPMGRLYAGNLRALGLLRGDIENVGCDDDWDYLIIANRGGFLSEREDLKTLTKKAAVTRWLRGVPVAWVVEKKH